ncbi:hypothetical protein DFP94_10867 [Fontibacillus phaseoli]|uniref:Uncharacterized protein n=1 Tax=Fontibacillus phaseoli TaxID=1416533 RepID=A0A369BAT3_9BACL|nr:hypothetical protein DFP94_10867 [Fontibacillus phaseoli]
MSMASTDDRSRAAHEGDGDRLQGSLYKSTATVHCLPPSKPHPALGVARGAKRLGTTHSYCDFGLIGTSRSSCILLSTSSLVNGYKLM